jgi:hypothetical protein
MRKQEADFFDRKRDLEEGVCKLDADKESFRNHVAHSVKTSEDGLKRLKEEEAKHIRLREELRRESSKMKEERAAVIILLYNGYFDRNDCDFWCCYTLLSLYVVNILWYTILPCTILYYTALYFILYYAIQNYTFNPKAVNDLLRADEFYAQIEEERRKVGRFLYEI